MLEPVPELALVLAGPEVVGLELALVLVPVQAVKPALSRSELLAQPLMCVVKSDLALLASTEVVESSKTA